MPWPLEHWHAIPGASPDWTGVFFNGFRYTPHTDRSYRDSSGNRANQAGHIPTTDVGSGLHFGRKALQCDLNVFQDSLSTAKCMQQVVLGDRGIWQDLKTDPAVLV